MHVRKGFTLAELLVVIGVIAVLISILLPVFHRVREQANRVVCASNEKQIYYALIMYAADYKGVMPVPGWYGGPLWPNLMIVQSDVGWYDYTKGVLWPYVRGTDSRQRLFLCPSDGPDRQVIIDEGSQQPDPVKRRNFTYNFNGYMSGTTGPPVMTERGVVAAGLTGVRLGQIRGPEHKLLVLEANDPRDSSESMLTADNNNRFIHPFATRHSGRGNQCFADGHVELFGNEDMLNVTIGKHYCVLTPMEGGYLP